MTLVLIGVLRGDGACLELDLGVKPINVSNDRSKKTESKSRNPDP